MTKERYDVPEFVEFELDDKTACIPFEKAVSNPDFSVRVMRSALNEAQAWNQRYAAFFERIGDRVACEIVDAIHRARQIVIEEQAIEQGIEFDPNDETQLTD